MSISVGVANPGTISGVGVANPGHISGVSVANPGRITSVGNANSAPAAAAPSVSNPAGLDINALLAAARQSGAAAGAPPPPVYAPKLDLAAINAQARQAAENNVNPFYVKSLNDFTAQQAAQRATEQQQHDINVKNLQDELSQTLQANDVTKTRTAEDAATKESDIANNADNFQTDSGGQYNMDRIALAKQQAAGGNAGSGLAAGETAAADAKHNTTEQRQGDQFAQEKQQAELFKDRTFEDLATSSANAQTAEGKGETQAKFDLDKFIQAQGFDLAGKQQQLEESRLQRIASETSNQGKLLVNNFINNISDPAKRQAALQAYGGAF